MIDSTVGIRWTLRASWSSGLVSHRTGNSLSKKENSNARDHGFKCNYDIKYKDFKILAKSPNKHSLLFLESLFIKQLSPSLNTSTTSIPLKIA